MKQYDTPFRPKRGLPRLTPAQRDFIINFDDEDEAPREPGRRRKATTKVCRYKSENGVRTWEFVPGEPIHGIEIVSGSRAKRLRREAASGVPLASLVEAWDLRPEWIEEILTTNKPLYRFGQVD